MIKLKDTLLNISACRNRRFVKAQALLKRLTAILVEKYHVNKVILIGSLIEPERFGFHSDIDLCVEGLPDNLYFKAVGELLLEADEFDVDIIPIEDATSEIKEKILGGKIIYEKRRNLS